MCYLQKQHAQYLTFNHLIIQLFNHLIIFILNYLLNYLLNFYFELITFLVPIFNLSIGYSTNHSNILILSEATSRLIEAPTHDVCEVFSKSCEAS